MASSPTRRPRRTLAKKGGGPSRLQNKRQAKIIEMVDGYESTATISAALRNVLLVWTLPGLALTALGLLGLAGATRSMSAAHLRWLSAVQAGAVLLQVVTVICSILWAVRTWGNIRRLGKVARVGVWKIFLRHVWFLVASIILLVAAVMSESGRALLILLGLATGVFAGLFVPFVVLETVRLFWRSGSPPNGGRPEDLPAYGMLWFASWLGYSMTNGAHSYPQLGMALVSALTMISGLSCLVAALTGARLAAAISRRQDDRLRAIISQVELDGTGESTGVTNHQIESSWDDSENLVSFRAH